MILNLVKTFKEYQTYRLNLFIRESPFQQSILYLCFLSRIILVHKEKSIILLLLIFTTLSFTYDFFFKLHYLYKT